MAQLPVFATALGLPRDYFTEAFIDPMFRLRLSHYPSVDDAEPGKYGAQSLSCFN